MPESSPVEDLETPSTPVAVTRVEDSTTRVKSTEEGSSSGGQGSSISANGLGVRKRVDSAGEHSFLSMARGKRPRLSAMAMPSSYGERDSIGFGVSA